jgi:tRNA (uracil-5-)-methyltransferase
MAAAEQSRKKRQNQGRSKFKNKRRKTTSARDQPEWPENGAEDVLLKDIGLLLQRSRIQDAEATNPKSHPQVTVKVSELSSIGDGLAFHEESNSVLVVPFSVPGDVVKVKPYQYFEDTSHCLTELLGIVEPSPLRDDSLARCQYFSKCSGCQLQMLPYEEQLQHKRQIIEKAFRNFSGLDASLVPEVQDTVASPLQYGYRTKLTPHFDQPAGFRSARRKGEKNLFWPEVPPIGFMVKNTRRTMDIEDCVIGTDVVRLGMKSERASVAKNIQSYKKGRTILLREDTERYSKSEKPSLGHLDTSETLYGPIVQSSNNHYDLKTCITNHNSTTREFVGEYVFSNPAGAFFQNNNSILEPFVQYIGENILPKSGPKISYLVDAYCGSGLFTITLSKLFERSVGIDIAPSSIDYAHKNAQANNIPEDRARFTAADAAEIFRDIDFPAARTAVVIDPPRKGCDRNFLRQLLRFGPARVVYVSCNVHTQARDIGVLVNGMEGVGDGAYEIESLRGFDFFPQTGHVEGVAVLRRKESEVPSPES